MRNVLPTQYHWSSKCFKDFCFSLTCAYKTERHPELALRKSLGKQSLIAITSMSVEQSRRDVQSRCFLDIVSHTSIPNFFFEYILASSSRMSTISLFCSHKTNECMKVYSLHHQSAHHIWNDLCALLDAQQIVKKEKKKFHHIEKRL